MGQRVNRSWAQAFAGEPAVTNVAAAMVTLNRA